MMDSSTLCWLCFGAFFNGLMITAPTLFTTEPFSTLEITVRSFSILLVTITAAFYFLIKTFGPDPRTIWVKNTELTFWDEKTLPYIVGWTDLVDVDVTKRALEQIWKKWTSGSRIRLLFYGPKYSGKSTIIRSWAVEHQTNLIECSPETFQMASLDCHLIRQIFIRNLWFYVRKQRCILLMSNFDELLHDVQEEFLAQWKAYDQCLVVFTVKEKCTFSDRSFLSSTLAAELPSFETRRESLDAILQGATRSGMTTNISQMLSYFTYGFSKSEMKQVRTIVEKEVAVSKSAFDIEKCLQQISEIVFTEKREPEEKEEDSVLDFTDAVHKAGHCMVAQLLPASIPVLWMNLDARHRSPTEFLSRSREEILCQAMVLLAGSAAEQVLLKHRAVALENTREGEIERFWSYWKTLHQTGSKVEVSKLTFERLQMLQAPKIQESQKEEKEIRAKEDLEEKVEDEKAAGTTEGLRKRKNIESKIEVEKESEAKKEAGEEEEGESKTRVVQEKKMGFLHHLLPDLLPERLSETVPDLFISDSFSLFLEETVINKERVVNHCFGLLCNFFKTPKQFEALEKLAKAFCKKRMLTQLDIAEILQTTPRFSSKPALICEDC